MLTNNHGLFKLTVYGIDHTIPERPIITISLINFNNNLAEFHLLNMIAESAVLPRTEPSPDNCMSHCVQNGLLKYAMASLNNNQAMD